MHPLIGDYGNVAPRIDVPLPRARLTESILESFRKAGTFEEGDLRWRVVESVTSDGVVSSDATYRPCVMLEMYPEQSIQRNFIARRLLGGPTRKWRRLPVRITLWPLAPDRLYETVALSTWRGIPGPGRTVYSVWKPDDARFSRYRAGYDRLITNFLKGLK